MVRTTGNRRRSTFSARMTNRLYYGDNLQVLRENIADESIDLIRNRPGLGSL
jgi:hypothetical protein